MDRNDLIEAEAFGWVNTAAPAQAAERPLTRTAAPEFSAIPGLLQTRDQWVLWKLKDRAGKQTKVPYYVRTGDDGAQVKPASTTDPTTWSSFDKIREEFERFAVRPGQRDRIRLCRRGRYRRHRRGPPA